MNELQTFNYEDKQIHLMEKDGVIWFVLKDVCDILDLSNSRVVADRLDEDERRKLDLPRQGETWVINESGLYSVILRSDKPEAKSFRKWVTSEVLPTIRRNRNRVSGSDVEGIISLLKHADDIMQAQKASGYDQAVVAQSIFQQCLSKDFCD